MSKTGGRQLQRVPEFLPDQLRKSLKKWYPKHARTLPWRETSNPYHIWISEIMLQQTTVKAVVPYFQKFLKRFPDVEQLAMSTEEDVLQYWEGLGYYSRGRNILKAAQLICSKHAGSFPSELQELLELPGIGRYTAGAIRAFGFNKPAPIVEANTVRLYCRLTGYEDDPRNAAGQKHLWNFAEAIQPTRVAGTLNQSLMELGSLICTPQDPACDSCPLMTQCTAFALGKQAVIPRKKTKQVITPLLEGTLAIQSGKKFLIRQRTASERWVGLWDFPRFELTDHDAELKLTSQSISQLSAEIQSQAQAMTQVVITCPNYELQIRHSVTRYRIRLLCFRGQLDQPAPKTLPAGLRWVTARQLRNLPMPVSGRKFADFLEKLLE